MIKVDRLLLERPTAKKINGVLAIGNFDGVHMGHQALLKKLVDQAHKLAKSSVVLIFEPLAREFFAANHQDTPARLTRLREKIYLLADCHIDRVVVIPFNKQLSNYSPFEFIRLLCNYLSFAYLIIGDDFRFGCKRSGGLSDLALVANHYHFQLEIFQAVMLDGRRVSSSWVRQCLARHDFATIRRLLGRSYSMIGRVIQGLKVGRKIGFPTINIRLQRKCSPLHGIYAVVVHGLQKNQVFKGAAYISQKPIHHSEHLLEVFIFDFSRMVYGLEVRVDFLAHIRDDSHFASLEELKAQISRDLQVISDFFADNPLKDNML